MKHSLIKFTILSCICFGILLSVTSLASDSITLSIKESPYFIDQEYIVKVDKSEHKLLAQNNVSKKENTTPKEKQPYDTTKSKMSTKKKGKSIIKKWIRAILIGIVLMILFRFYRLKSKAS